MIIINLYIIMKKIISVAVFVAFLSLASIAFAIGEIPSFSDVPKEAYYYDAAGYLQHKNIMKGNDGQFRPGDNITRAETATIIYRYHDEIIETLEEQLLALKYLQISQLAGEPWSEYEKVYKYFNLGAAKDGERENYANKSINIESFKIFAELVYEFSPEPLEDGAEKIIRIYSESGWGEEDLVPFYIEETVQLPNSNIAIVTPYGLFWDDLSSLIDTIPIIIQ